MHRDIVCAQSGGRCGQGLYADVQRKRLELLRPFAIFQSESPPAPQLIAEQSPGELLQQESVRNAAFE